MLCLCAVCTLASLVETILRTSRSAGRVLHLDWVVVTQVNAFVKSQGNTELKCALLITGKGTWTVRRALQRKK